MILLCSYLLSGITMAPAEMVHPPCALEASWRAEVSETSVGEPFFLALSLQNVSNRDVLVDLGWRGSEHLLQSPFEDVRDHAREALQMVLATKPEALLSKRIADALRQFG